MNLLVKAAWAAAQKDAGSGDAMIALVPVKGYFEENCYFYIDDATGHGFLIDPGAQADVLAQIIRQHGWTIEKILLTHGHFDHMGAANELRQALDIPIYAHENSDTYLLDPSMNLSVHCGPPITVPHARKLKDADSIQLASNPGILLKVIHTPGHTTDSVAYYCPKEGIDFVGDTIFKGSIGSTRYPGGNFSDLKRSIRGRLFKLPDNTVLLSGHSGQTTVGEEKLR